MRNAVSAIISLRMLWLLLALTITSSAYPAPQFPEPELSWKNVTVDGKKAAVFCVFKDSRGIMWLGTNCGLYFYDGVTSHAVGETELFGLQIYSIVEKDDRLFIGSNNGLLTYDYASGAVNESISESPKEIRALLLVDDDIWIGGLDGICRFDISDQKLSFHSKGLPHRSVYSLLRDSRGIVYAGTYNGVARWDTNDETFKPLKVRINETGGRTSLFANCMLESHDKESIYIGGEGALYKYTPVNEHWEKVSPFGKENIKSLSRGSGDHILIGTDDGVFDMSGDALRHYRHDTRQELSLADNEIWCIYADAQNNIWAGHERGVSIASNSTTLRTIKLSTFAHSGEGNEIHTIYRDTNDNLWIGGTNGVIRLSYDSTPHWYRHTDAADALSHNRVRAIHEDMSHNIWFATDAGINRFNKTQDNFDVFHIVDKDGEHNSNWVYALAEDDSHFWIGSFLNGLHYVDKTKFNGSDRTIVSDEAINADSRPSGLANDLVNDLIKDSDGNLWILLFRDNSLTRFTPSTNKFVKYDIHELTGGYPTNICPDNQGRIWCAFKGGAVIFSEIGRASCRERV